VFFSMTFKPHCRQHKNVNKFILYEKTIRKRLKISAPTLCKVAVILKGNESKLNLFFQVSVCIKIHKIIIEINKQVDKQTPYFHYTLILYISFIIIIIYVMELGHLLTRSGLTYPEISSKVCHNSFCRLGIAFHYSG
jgi:hypothetical protein